MCECLVREFYWGVTYVSDFVNVGNIVQGLSAFAPETAAIQSGSNLTFTSKNSYYKQNYK
jgi:hypothetical protein